MGGYWRVWSKKFWDRGLVVIFGRWAFGGFIDKMSPNRYSLINANNVPILKYTMVIKSTIKPPKELKQVGEKALFRGIVGTYSSDFFNTADIPMLVQYVQLKLSADRCYAIVLADGEVIYNTKGELVPSPYLKAYTGLCSTMANLSQKLRIAPSSRMRQESPGGSAGKAKNSKDYKPDNASAHNTSWKDQQRE